MSKNEFLSELFGLLSDISPEEREEAMNYYREYIEDAGLENEDAILQELGSPADVAAAIQSELFHKDNAQQDFSSNNNRKFPTPRFSSEYNSSQKTSAPSNNSTYTILAIIAAVLLFPVWFPAILSVIAFLFSCMVALFGFVLAFGIGGIACILTGICLFVYGIVRLFTNPLTGIILIATSFIVAALGLILFLAALLMGGGLIPAVLRLCSNIFYCVPRLFSKLKKQHS